MFFGLGYCHAADFPVLTSYHLLRNSGVFAAVIGDYLGAVEADIQSRLWQIPGIANRQRILSDPGLVSLLQAYVDGVNLARQEWATGSGPPFQSGFPAGGGAAFLVNNTEPVAFASEARLQRLLEETITIDHVFQFGVFVAGLEAIGRSREEATGQAAEQMVVTGSNAWIIGGALSDTGMPLLSTDPHVRIDAEGFRSYFVTLRNTTGGFHFSGWGTPGAPLLYVGFNDHIAYGVTDNRGRSYQVWRIPSLSSHTEFELDGQITPFVTSVETITVWERPSTTSTQTVGLRWADSGSQLPFDVYPVIEPATIDPSLIVDPSPPAPDPDEEVYYARGTFATANSIWGQLYDLHTSSTVMDAEAALANYSLASQNMLIADNSGGMFYLFGTRVPDYKSLFDAGPIPASVPPLADFDFEMIQDGEKSFLRWDMVHPTTDLPQAMEPAGVAGVWINCNTSPESTVEGTALNYTIMPWALSNEFPPYMVSPSIVDTNWRQRRAETLLRPGTMPPPQFTVADNESFAVDINDNYAEGVVPLFVALMYRSLEELVDDFAIPPYLLDAFLKVLTVLISWDRGPAATARFPAGINDPEPTLWTMIRSRYLANLVAVEVMVDRLQDPLVVDQFSIPHDFVTDVDFDIERRAAFGAILWVADRIMKSTTLGNCCPANENFRGLDLSAAPAPCLMSIPNAPFIEGGVNEAGSGTASGPADQISRFGATHFLILRSAGHIQCKGIWPVAGTADALFNSFPGNQNLFGFGYETDRLDRIVISDVVAAIVLPPPGVLPPITPEQAAEFLFPQIPPAPSGSDATAVLFPHSLGSGSLIAVSVGPTQTIGGQIAAAGNSEIVNDARGDRYRMSPRLSSRTWKELKIPSMPAMIALSLTVSGP